MSMKFKKNLFVVNLILAALISKSAWAGIQGVRSSTSPQSSSGKPNAPVVVKPGKVTDEKVTIGEGTATVKCNMDQDASAYFPLDFFQHIIRDGSSLKFEQRADNKVSIKFPAILDVCGKFKPQIHQDTESKNVTLMMTLDNGKSYSEYIACLTEKGFLVDGKIDHDKIEGKNYSEYSYIMDYSFDKKSDIKKTAKISYGYPKAFNSKDGYAAAYGFDEKVSPPDSLCMVSEKIGSEITYINKGQDVLIEEINAICRANDAQKIAEARKAYGNAEALKDIAEKIKAELDAKYLVAAQEDVKRISKEMAAIEERINKGKDTMDESTAKKEMAKYAELAKELDSKFLNPAIYRIDTLIQKRDVTEEGPALRAIDEEIKKLNEQVGQFSKRQPTSFANMYSLMEKYAINDSAKTIEDIRVKSYLYSKVYGGPVDERRGKPITFESANQQQADRVVKFDRTLTDWTDQYLVGQGNLYPIKKTEKERQMMIDRMNSRWANYEKEEYKNYNNYCAAGMTGSPKNPIKCKEFMSTFERRRTTELKRREKDLTAIGGKDKKLERMGMNYNEYQRKIASREMEEANAYDPFGSSYTSYEDNFADRFPGYYGPTTSTVYDPNMYNMAGGNQAMMLGQQRQQFQMPGQQVMPGQFQMPQMGGWPGLP